MGFKGAYRGFFLSTSSFPADVCHGFTDVLSLIFMVALEVASQRWAAFPQSLTVETFKCTDAHPGLEFAFLQISSYVHQSPFANTLHVFLSAWLFSLVEGIVWGLFVSFFFF